MSGLVVESHIAVRRRLLPAWLDAAVGLPAPQYNNLVGLLLLPLMSLCCPPHSSPPLQVVPLPPNDPVMLAAARELASRAASEQGRQQVLRMTACSLQPPVVVAPTPADSAPAHHLHTMLCCWQTGWLVGFLLCC